MGAPSGPATAEPGQGAQRDELAYAQRVLRAEAGAIDACAATLDGRFLKAVGLIVACADADGTVLVTGLGKSGLIGAKIAATLSSLGIPAHPVHPTEAAHGDLGRFRAKDAVLCLSRSGETEEVVNLAAILCQDRLPIVSITAGGHPTHAPSSLERLATVALHIGEFAEAGEGPEAPTTSTAVTLALGDALALTAARRRRFTDADFAQRHPGGTLGGLLRPVCDVVRLRVGQGCSVVDESTPVIDAIADAGRRAGAVLVVDKTGVLVGIFTDADLRRRFCADADGEWKHAPIGKVMTASPSAIHQHALVRDAVRITRERRVDEIPVTDDGGRPVGILDVQDLIAMRLVRDDESAPSRLASP